MNYEIFNVNSPKTFKMINYNKNSFEIKIFEGKSLANPSNPIVLICISNETSRLKKGLE